MAAAIELADRDGIESISMRRLAQELGVEAMSLYTHVRNKNDLLDGMTNAVISQIPMSADGGDWKTSLRQLVLAARSVMLRHPWAPRPRMRTGGRPGSPTRGPVGSPSRRPARSPGSPLSPTMKETGPTRHPLG